MWGRPRARDRERLDNGRIFGPHRSRRIFRTAQRGCGARGRPGRRPPPPPPRGRQGARARGFKARRAARGLSARRAAGARAGPGRGGHGAGRRDLHGRRGPDGGAARSPTPAQRSRPRAGTPDGARARGAPTALGGAAAAPGRAAARRLPGGGSRYAPPARGCPALSARPHRFSGHLCAPPPRLSLRGPPPRSVLAACRVTNLVSSSLAGPGAGRLLGGGARDEGAGAPLTSGTTASLVSTWTSNEDPGVGRLEPSNYPGRLRRKGRGRKGKATSGCLRGRGAAMLPLAQSVSADILPRPAHLPRGTDACWRQRQDCPRGARGKAASRPVGAVAPAAAPGSPQAARAGGTLGAGTRLSREEREGRRGVGSGEARPSPRKPRLETQRRDGCFL